MDNNWGVKLKSQSQKKLRVAIKVRAEKQQMVYDQLSPASTLREKSIQTLCLSPPSNKDDEPDVFAVEKIAPTRKVEPQKMIFDYNDGRRLKLNMSTVSAGLLNKQKQIDMVSLMKEINRNQNELLYHSREKIGYVQKKRMPIFRMRQPNIYSTNGENKTKTL